MHVKKKKKKKADNQSKSCWVDMIKKKNPTLVCMHQVLKN